MQAIHSELSDVSPPRPLIVVDGVRFQYLSSGIARVWLALLHEWAKSGFIKHVVFIARGNGEQPTIPGLRYVESPAFSYGRSGSDSLNLERICRELEADLFVSTYYTTPTHTPSLFFGYDMIPEVRGIDLATDEWHEKRLAILHAASHLMISENSARDLERIYTLSAESTHVAHCGIWKEFYRPEPSEIKSFREKYNLGGQPYLLMVGDRKGADGYKNGKLAFQAVGRIANQRRFTLVCVGGSPLIEEDLSASVPHGRVVRLAIGDGELRAAYGGAHAFLYPSRYEGFGMPILEAMACGAPVITCNNSSIIEVAGDAALFVGEDDVEGMLAAIARLEDQAVRADFVTRGAEQAAKFDFAAMADRVAHALLETHRRISCGDLKRPNPVWQDLREMVQNTQSIPAVMVSGRKIIRSNIVAVARKIGFDPAKSRSSAKIRKILGKLMPNRGK
jgi:glycosyltransferase involved in cell wall biosynthesis